MILVAACSVKIASVQKDLLRLYGPCPTALRPEAYMMCIALEPYSIYECQPAIGMLHGPD
jgi:hypothetical protein